jgi:hypothetical protein
MQGVSKRAIQLYFKCYCAASVKNMFTLEGVQTIYLSYIKNINKRFVHGTKLGCDQTVENLEPIDGPLAFTCEGTISRTANIYRCTVRVRGRGLGKTPTAQKDRCSASHATDPSLW